jgi:hypothetical protein
MKRVPTEALRKTSLVPLRYRYDRTLRRLLCARPPQSHRRPDALRREGMSVDHHQTRPTGHLGDPLRRAPAPTSLCRLCFSWTQSTENSRRRVEQRGIRTNRYPSSSLSNAFRKRGRSR